MKLNNGAQTQGHRRTVLEEFLIRTPYLAYSIELTFLAAHYKSRCLQFSIVNQPETSY